METRNPFWVECRNTDSKEETAIDCNSLEIALGVAWLELANFDTVRIVDHMGELVKSQEEISVAFAIDTKVEIKSPIRNFRLRSVK